MKLIDLKNPREEEWKSAAAYLRELADRFEKGEISEAVVVFNDRENNCFESFGHFEDRWRLFGALEYAKAGMGKAP
jgi:hypothetical protein